MPPAEASEKALAGRTAVVTGASSGIGRAIAETFGAAGAHVVLGGRTPGPMAESVAKISAGGGSGEAHVLDVRKVQEMRAFVAHATESTGRLDIMVNNAGLSHPEAILDEKDPEHWRVMLETNVFALLVGSQAAVEAMRACGAEGHLVNISSVAALRLDSGVYGATKHAVNCINNSLRRELMEEPIKVLTVMPGAIATNFARNFDSVVLQGLVGVAGSPEAAAIEITKGERLPDELLANAQAALPGHLCTPEDVAEAVLWAVTRPAGVHLSEIVVRPKRDLNL
ncbi:MAG TPA: SDR family oxidoreductase [Acidimicrobiales bacterium]|nr:SDR family oxidoreductase [Acidimicrobiales bacterium]